MQVDRKADRYRRFGFLLGIVALGIAAYWGAWENEFVYDDTGIIENNPRVHDLGQVERIFTTEYWDLEGVESKLYRPLTLFSFALEAEFLGLDPGHFHVVNVGLHLLTSVLVAFLGQVLWKRRFRDDDSDLHGAAAGFVAGALFAIHPVHGEAVLNTVGRAEILAGLFTVSTLLALLSGRRALWAVPILAAAACLSKESGFLVLPIVLLLALVVPGDGDRRWRWVGVLVVLLGVLGAGLLRSYVLRDIPTPSVHFDDNPLALASLPDRWATAASVFWKYLGLHFWPVGLSPDYSHASIEVRKLGSAAGLSAIAGLIALLGVLGWMLWKSRSFSSLTGFFLCWYVGGMIAAGNFFLVIGTILGERLTYLPDIGFFLAIGFAAAKFVQLRFPGRVAVGAVELVGVIALFLVPVSVARTADWRTSLDLFEQASLDQPKSFRVWALLGNIYYQSGRQDEARVALNRSLQIYDEFPQTWVDKVALHYNAAEYDSAATAAERLRELTPYHVYGYLAIGEQQLRSGELARALELASAGVETHPGQSRLHDLRGRVQVAAGDNRSAIDSFRRTLAIDPGLSAARTALGRLLMAEQRWEEAVVVYRELVLNNQDWQTGNALAWSLLQWANQSGSPLDVLREAERHALASVRVAPDAARRYPMDTAVQIYLEIGGTDSAAVWADRLVSEFPDVDSYREQYREIRN